MRVPRGALVAVAFAVLYLWAFPFFGKMQSANELPRLLVTEEVVEAHTFRIDRRLAELGSQFDVATTPDGHKFSNKAPGASLVVVPAYALVHAIGGRPSTAFATWLFRFLAATVPAFLLLWFMRGPLARFAGGGDEAAGPGVRAALVALGAGSMILPYGMLFMSHAMAATAAAGAFTCAIMLVRGESRRPDLWALGTGLCCGLAVLADYQAAIAVLGIGLYAFFGTLPRVRGSVVLGIALGGAPSAILLGIYHRACFGSPLKTGYSYAPDPAHKQGVLGIVGPNREAMWNVWLAPENGIVVLTPWVLLAIAGAVIVLRDPARRRALGAEVVTAGGIALAYLFFVGSLVPEFGRAGWSVGPRYAACALPFLALLAAPALAVAARRPAVWIGALTLIGVGVLVHVLAATTFPHWPTTFRNPLLEVSARAIREGLAPHSLLTWAGLRGWITLVPVWGAALALLAWAGGVFTVPAGPSRTRALAATGAALAAAMVIVFVGYARFPRSEPKDMAKRWGYVESVWEPR